ncbi:MAG: HAMP domain-containing histidine kinase [Clostridiales bacterium]|nr:HAMP domain-containing histidine kinase [Clostridiales bacterium]
MLREKLEHQKEAQLALQKQNKMMVLSLSHDLKTPLSLIELYSKALEKGLYKDEQKNREVVNNICSKCEDIREYIDEIVKTTSEDFLELEVNNGEFFLSVLIDSIRKFYTDKLGMLKIGFSIDPFSDCLLSGDLDRSIEVIQNIFENAIKYGDGRMIEIAFSREEDCQLIHISNSGCTLPDGEIPHVFDCFWRGSNCGSKNGSGLGLYICRALMHKMNGDIYADVREGNMIVTTVFTLS